MLTKKRRTSTQGGQPKRARLQSYKGDQKFKRLQKKCENRSIAISKQLELEELELDELLEELDEELDEDDELLELEDEESPLLTMLSMAFNNRLL